MTSAASSPVRRVGDNDLPTAGHWTVDPSHADVGFWGRHFMITKVRGRFTGVDAAVLIAERPEESSVRVVIDMASVHSGDSARDDHLRSPDFFDVEHWPVATFQSTAIRWNGRTGSVTGDLTIRNVTMPVTLDVEFHGAVRDPWGNDRAVFEAHGIIDREDWDLTWNQVLETGGLLVSKEIHLEMHVELIRER